MTQRSSSGPSGKFSRYVVVTGVAAAANVLLLKALLDGVSLPAPAAAVLAGSTVSCATYLMCVRWVWRGSPRVRGAALMFWMSTLLNLALAGAAVQAVAALTGAGSSALSMVPTVTYVVTWAARFVWLDRWLLQRSPSAAR